MNFGAAFRHCTKDRMPMRLPHWKEDVSINVSEPGDCAAATHPFLYVKSRNGIVPWMPTVVELFSEEWEVIDEKNES